MSLLGTSSQGISDDRVDEGVHSHDDRRGSLGKVGNSFATWKRDRASSAHVYTLHDAEDDTMSPLGAVPFAEGEAVDRDSDTAGSAASSTPAPSRQAPHKLGTTTFELTSHGRQPPRAGRRPLSPAQINKRLSVLMMLCRSSERSHGVYSESLTPVDRPTRLSDPLQRVRRATNREHRHVPTK